MAIDQGLLLNCAWPTDGSTVHPGLLPYLTYNLPTTDIVVLP